MEGLEDGVTRPRQVRYQAALRPDSWTFSDSRPLPQRAALSRRDGAIAPSNREGRGRTSQQPGPSRIGSSTPYNPGREASQSWRWQAVGA